MSELYETLRRYRECVFPITSTNHEGDEGIGTGFHVGDGRVVTARHVIEGRRNIRVGGAEVKAIHCASEPGVDVAVIETDVDPHRHLARTTYVRGDERIPGDKVHARYIPLGLHLDDWVDDGLVLMKCLLMGFPPVPTSRDAILVAAEAEINAVVDRYTSSGVHFIISGPARGGFSGGPVVMPGPEGEGWLLGLVTESILPRPDSPVETGFLTVLSVEAILKCLHESGYRPPEIEDDFWRLFDGEPGVTGR